MRRPTYSEAATVNESVSRDRNFGAVSYGSSMPFRCVTTASS